MLCRMKLDLNQLPDDAQLLQQLIRELAQDLSIKQEIIEEKTKLADDLERRLAELNRYRFGQRSQKINPDQLSLWQEALDSDISETKQALRVAPVEKALPTTKGQAKRKPLPENLPRETVQHQCSDTHCQCGHPLHKIGLETCEELHWRPANFYVKRHEQVKYACRYCDSITTAEKPTRPIEKGLFGSSMLSYLVVSKYQDHIPVDRLQRICERSQITLATSTLNDALGRCGWILRPLVERIKDYVLRQQHIHTDDTVIPVIDAKKGKTKQGRLWVYLHSGTDGPPAVFFDYTANRSQRRPLDLLKHYKGYLQADGYKGYEALYQGGDIFEVACWAHARAKFESVEKRTASPIAQQTLAFIAQLYQIETDIKYLSVEERYSIRQARALPILDSIKTHLEDSLLRVAKNSDVAKPIFYVLKRWDALIRYCEDGRLHIDNNPAERCIRPTTIGRKNWVFAGSDLAAERAAVMYSIIETCKLNGIDPFAYLTDIFERIADYPNRHIDELLPFNWQPVQKAA